jgi:hypothetical protein
MIAIFSVRRGNTGNAGNSAISQGSAPFLDVCEAGERGERTQAPVPSVPLTTIKRERGKRLLHKAVPCVPYVLPANTGGKHAY